VKIAVVGSGITGNVAAYHLARQHEITVYEAAPRIGGHTHTHTITRLGQEYRVDTGFIVYNDSTYPNFVRLLDELGVSSQPSSMSFSVRDERDGLEYNGTSLNTLFAQRRNLVRPAFWRMLRDILRFNREAPALLAPGVADTTLGEYLAEHRYSREFVERYIVPMGAAIWSTDPASMHAFPARFFVRFFHNHGMFSIDARPQWRVIRGGSARYLDKLTARYRERVRLSTPVERIQRRAGEVVVHARGCASERYDAVFIACHSDQALRLLDAPTALERDVLGAIRYQESEAVLHTDTSLLPRNRRARAAWNYRVPIAPQARVALTYDMNILQSLAADPPFLVTLNRTADIAPQSIIESMTYAHPLFTPSAVAAQARHRELNGTLGSYYCGAYWRYGFHEDGVMSALDALSHFEHDCAAGRARRVA